MKVLHKIYCEKGFYLGQWYGVNRSDAVVQARLSGAQINFKRACSAVEL